MKKSAVLLLLASLCACVYSQVKVQGTASVSGSASINSGGSAHIVSLALAPLNQTQQVGQQVGYSATVTLSDGTTLDVTNYGNWSSSNVAIAGNQVLSTVESFTCLSGGTAQIAVQYGTIFASTPLTCSPVVPPTPVLTSIAVSPTLPTVNVGQGMAFTATGTYSDGSQQDLTSTVTWLSASTAVATLGTGTPQPATCLTAGTSVISATDPTTSITGNTTITCKAVLSSIAVTPASPSVLVGAQPAFIATCTMSDGSKNDCSLQAVWTSSSTTIATVNTPTPADPQGYTAKSAGTTTVKAQIGSVNGTTVLTVTNPGPPPPTLSSITVTPTTPSVNVGQSINLIATGNFSDGSTAPLTAPSTWTTSNAAVASLQLEDCVVGQACTEPALSGTGSTPWTFSAPSATAPAGAIDVLDYMLMPLPDRNNFHLSGDAVKYFRLAAGLAEWIKSSSGCPADGEYFDTNGVYQWYTEGPTFSNCSGYKKYVNPLLLWPRYFLPGSDIVIKTPGPNLYIQTENCGADNQPAIDNLDAKGELQGPFTDIAWTTTYGGDIPNGTAYLLQSKYIKGTGGVYQTREQYWDVLGFGQARWCTSHLSGGSYIVDQCSTNTHKVAGGPGTTNFACKIPNRPTVSLPPGQPTVSAPEFNMADTNGAITGTGILAGTFPFTVQQEDAGGAFHLQNQIIRVVATAGQALQTVNCVGPGTATITATDGISGSTVITCQNPPPTLSSISVTPASPTINQGQGLGFIATGTFSDGSKQDVTSIATWTLGTPAVASLGPLNVSPQIVNCVTAGTSTVTATIGAVNNATTLTCSATLSSVAVTPANQTVLTNTNISYVATGTFSDGSQQNVTSAATWSISNSAVASLGVNSGSSQVVRCLTAGSVTITATVGAVTNNTPLTCQIPAPPPPTLVSIAVTPALPSVTVGQSIGFIATGTFSDGTQQNLTTASGTAWSSGTPAHATLGTLTTVQSVTCIAAGTSVIQATNTAISGSTTITCVAPVPTLTSIAVTPASPNQNVGGTVNFIATGTYSDGSTQDITQSATWSSITPSVATLGTRTTIQPATCIAAGTSSIHAVLSAIIGSTTLTCTALPPTLTSVTVTPANPTSTVGSAVNFTATCNFSDGSQQNCTTSSAWTSSNTAVSTVSLAGTTEAGTCATVGSSTIKAAQGTIFGTTLLTCQAATPPSQGNDAYCTAGNVPHFGATDSYANLPATCFYTNPSAFTSGGAVHHVSNAAQLTTAIGGTVCGDIIQIDASFAVTEAPLPALHCSAGTTVTIQGLGFASLPAYGTRVKPCFWGVASMAGYPAFNCASTTVIMPTLTSSPSSGTGAAFKIPAGGFSYLIIKGINFTRTTGSGLITDLAVDDTAGGQFDHFILEHDGFSGTLNDETNRAMVFNRCNFCAVLDSFASELHCKSGATGACTDAKFIGDGTNTHAGDTDNTHKIVNNFAATAAQCLLSGGAAAVITPTSLEWRNNYCFKPLTWDPANPAYNGGIGGVPIIVKNGLELKNGDRVLMEGNYLENNWSGFSQVGNAITLTPKNQSGTLCPLCFVTNVTVRYNWIKSYAQIFQIANVSDGSGTYATAGNSFSLHDNLGENMQDPTICYLCQSSAAMMTLFNAVPATDILHSVDVNHNTEVIAAGTTKAIYSGYTLGADAAVAPNNNAPVKWQNNVFPRGFWGGFHSSSGSASSCASAKSDAAGIINACFFPNGVATGNAILPPVLGTGGSPTWPAGNCTTEVSYTALFVNYNAGKGGNYAIKTTSPCHASGNDGKDPGADIPTLLNRIQNVTSF